MALNRSRHGRSLKQALRRAVLLITLAGTASLNAHGLELWANEESGQYLDLGVTLKLSGLGAYNPSDALFFPHRRDATGLTRARFGLNATLSEKVNAEFAYEHRARLTSGSGGVAASGGVLPGFVEAPYRLGQLDWQITNDENRFIYRHEIDRALAAFHPGWGEVTIGRQAIGLGRGVIFSAVDVFAPFSPVEVDREWRRGIDALRAEYRLTATSSAEIIAAFSDHWDDCAILGRLRGYVGNIDGELIIGKRARDAMFAAAMSAAVGDAEVHSELALFHTPDRHPDGGLFGEDHLIGKLVLGSSYTFDIGNALTLMGEYHYSGFGIEDSEDAVQRFLEPDFAERYLRGDTQILGQHALALQAAYPFNEVWSGGFLILESLTDGSGLASPSVIWTASQSTTFFLNAFLPWGPEPRQGKLQSEYGASPFSIFAQVSVYF